MKQMTVISGKGGTGKTTITAAFAALAENAVLADCDVDAADLHLILAPHVEHEEAFIGGQVAFIDPEACTKCNICLQHCRFDAIKDFCVDRLSCEGCTVCVVVCPHNAVSMKDKVSGRWFVSQTRFGPMVHAKLGIAEDNSGKLVAMVRQQAKKIAEEQQRDLVIIDGPPGIGCPVIAAITGADLVVVVTEPTLSGLHDLRRACETARHFNIPVVVCINKFDINPQNTAMIEDECRQKSIPVCGRLPYERSVTAAMIQQKSIIEHDCGPVSQSVTALWERISAALSKDSRHDNI
jgi:MinD superfamily P-loop ATPase